MSEHVLKPVIIRTLIACVLFTIAWMFAVKPAKAQLDDQLTRYDLQTRAVEAYAGTDTDEQATLRIEADLIERVEAIADAMTRHRTNASVIEQIDKSADERSVRVHRTEPRSSSKNTRPARGSDPATAAVETNEFFMEFSGNYANVVAFIAELHDTLGLIRVDDLRLTPSASPGVRAVMTITIYRVADRSVFTNAATEASDGD